MPLATMLHHGHEISMGHSVQKPEGKAQGLRVSMTIYIDITYILSIMSFIVSLVIGWSSNTYM